MLAFNVLSVKADKFSFGISFSLDDFEISYDERNHVHIFPKQDFSKFSYGSVDTPALPFYSYNFATSGSHSFLKLQIAGKESTLVASGIKIAANPKCIPTDTMQAENSASEVNYELKMFPDNCVCFTNSSNWTNLSVFHFIVSPFEYDARTGNLYFNSHMNVEFDSEKNSAELLHKAEAPRDLYYKEWDNSNFNSDMAEIVQTSNSNGPTLDYLIITNNKLKDAFKPLIDWKRTKGLKAGIVSVEEINTMYQDSSSPLHLKIKEYLYEKYINEGLSYVLLGGDDKVVPTLKCYIEANCQESENMPVDMYYACFGGSFNWDANDNGIYGELNDSINFAPSIFVSRVPTREVESTSQYVKKVLEYETEPKWNNNILMAGAKLYVKNSYGQSDAEFQSERLYN